MEKNEEKTILAPETKSELRKTSLYYTVFGSILAMIIIICHIFEERFQDLEEGMIKSIQSSFPKSTYSNSTFKALYFAINSYTDIKVLNGIFCFTYFAFHNFFTFKIALIANSVIILHTIAVLVIYLDPKPYSAYSDINTCECKPILTGPAYNQIICTLLISFAHMILSHFRIPLKSIGGILVFGFLILLNILTIVWNLINGEHFLYQCIIGILITGIITCICKFYDQEIDLQCLKVAFIIKSAKKHKFFVMAFYLGLLGAVLGFSVGIDEINIVQHEWIKNFIVIV